MLTSSSFVVPILAPFNLASYTVSAQIFDKSNRDDLGGDFILKLSLSPPKIWQVYANVFWQFMLRILY